MTEYTLRDRLFISPCWNIRTFETYTHGRQFVQEWRLGGWKYSDLYALNKERDELVVLMKECMDKFLNYFREHPVVDNDDDEIRFPVASWCEYNLLYSLLATKEVMDFNELSLYGNCNSGIVREILKYRDEDNKECLGDEVCPLPDYYRLPPTKIPGVC